jgi:hypothetical protein
MSSAAGLLPQDRHRVATPRIDYHIGAKALGVGELAVINVDRADKESHGLCILDGQMPKAANTGDGDPLTGLRRGLFDPFCRW